MNIRLVLTTGVAFFMMGCGGGVSSNIGNSDPDTANITSQDPFNKAPALTQAEKDKYLKAINDARDKSQDCDGKQIGPSPHVLWNDELYLASAEHNYDMAKSNIIDVHHRGSNTEYDWTTTVQNLDHASYMQERVENNGYDHWARLTENLTVGYISNNNPIDTPEEAVQQWLNSAGHCENLMDPNVTDVGMAYLYDANSDYKHYWTQNFGRKQ